MCWADPVKWLEVSLTVSPELAESVAEVIGRFTREGVVMEQLALPDEGGKTTVMSPQVHVFGYLLADGSLEEHKKGLEEALWHLGCIQPLPPAYYRPIKDHDWMESWKQHYQPIPIGQRLEILPAWVERHNPRRLPVHINPGMAFGTGTHPTTQLCLELMEKHLRPGMRAFDIGCGSGILSIAAVRLGAAAVVAVDSDPAAVSATQENCRLNGVAHQVEVELGSLHTILEGHFGSPQAPLVVANILSAVILRLFDDGLADAVQPNGILLLSGILEDQAEEIRQKGAQNGLAHVETRLMEDWAAISLRK